MEKIGYYIAKGLRKILQRPAICKSNINAHSRVCSGSQLYKVIMDRYSYIGHDCFLNNVEIGSFCSIADGCKIGGAAHQMGYVSTSPVFVTGKNVMRTNFADLQDTESRKTVIEHDVWLGMGCYIQEGVCIHTGSVVGMGSVVTKDIPPYEIWAGNPARKIRSRFDDEMIQELLDTKWWEFSEEKLMRYGESVSDPTEFIRISKLDT